ncbi:MAG: DoxX family protein [Gammaproteobacteria bacterium]
MNRSAAAHAATLALATVFAADGLLRLTRLEFHILQFAVWGYPAWMVWAVSVGQVVGAALLLWRRTFPAGVALLGLISFGFVVTHVMSGDGWVVIFPVAMLAGLAGLAVLRRGQPGTLG